MTVASGALQVSLALVLFIRIVPANIILECLSLLYCDGETPVCGSNGTHCWRADSDCERAKFNCLQFGQEDFDKVNESHCHEFTVGGMAACCVRKTCPNKTELMCGREVMLMEDRCRWFRNRCEMDNENCGSSRNFIEVSSESCGFEDDDTERLCTTRSEGDRGTAVP